MSSDVTGVPPAEGPGGASPAAAAPEASAPDLPQSAPGSADSAAPAKTHPGAGEGEACEHCGNTPQQ